MLGVLVGRGTAPIHFDMNRLQSELTELKMKMLEKERENLKKDTEALAEKQTVEFYEVLKDKKADASMSMPQPAKTPQPQAKAVTDSGKTDTKASPSKPKTTPATAATEKKPAEKKTAAEPAAQPANDKPEGGKHVIQVAATKDTAAADQLVAKLTQKGFPAFRIVSRVDENNVWYRVRVGAFNHPDEAAGMLAAIKKDFPGAMLINR